MTRAIETIDVGDIARMLGIKRRYATDVITKKPGFPSPRINLSQRIRRWELPQVLQWIEKRSQ